MMGSGAVVPQGWRSGGGPEGGTAEEHLRTFRGDDYVHRIN